MLNSSCFLLSKVTFFYIPPHNSVGVLWFHIGRPCVCPSVYLSVFLFTENNLVNINGFQPNLVCSLMLWRSGLGILMGKFCQFLTVICLPHICILFSQDTLHKYQWIFIKLGMCIDIVKIWSLVANGQILLIFERLICSSQDSGRVLSFAFFISLINLTCIVFCNCFFLYSDLLKLFYQCGKFLKLYNFIFK